MLKATRKTLTPYTADVMPSLRVFGIEVSAEFAEIMYGKAPANTGRCIAIVDRDVRLVHGCRVVCRFPDGGYMVGKIRTKHPDKAKNVDVALIGKNADCVLKWPRAWLAAIKGMHYGLA